MLMTMKLNAAPFEKIARGTKTVELRLFDEKRRTLSVGDEIVFTHTEKDGAQLRTRVTALYRADSFAELFLTDVFEKSGFEGKTREQALQAMREYYSAADENRFGVLGIEIKPI